MRRTPSDRPLGPGVRELLAAGVPVGPLADPNVFHQAGTGTKLHASSACSRISNRRRVVATRPVPVDLTRTDASAYCTDCVTAPTDTAAARYATHARYTLTARQQLADLRAELAAEATGPTRTSWHRVAQAKAVRHLVAVVAEHPRVHPAMAAFAADTYAGAMALHEQLHAQAAAASDAQGVLRGCVLDLTGDLPHHGDPREIRGHLEEVGAYPALCAGQYGGTARGYADRLRHAWLAWGDEVKLTGDLAAAGQAARAAGSVADLEPAHVAQLPKGPARTPAPPGTTPWDWMVEQWRLAAAAELEDILAGWTRRYRDAMAAARDEPDLVLALHGWTLEARTQVNASTELLARLAVVSAPGKDTALVVAPAAAARWLGWFRLTGTTRADYGYDAGAGTGQVLGPATGTDTPEVLATALRLWDPPAGGTGMGALGTALQVARGVHAAPPAHAAG